MATVPYDIHALDDPFYRSSDGKPMADNTTQFRWIVAVQGGLDSTFRADPDVLVVGDCLWYPVEGNNKIRVAPDAMVVLGRPKGPRGSYIQYREAGVTPQVVFEVLSPSNRRKEMDRKLEFYDTYGVEEYYILNPDRNRHKGYLRDAAGTLAPIPELFGWVSPRLGIRFEMTRELRILRPDGRPFEFYLDLDENRDVAVRQAVAANLRAEQAERLAEADRQRADRAAEQAEADRQRADLAAEQAEADRRAREAADGQVERLRAQLRAAGIDPDA